MTGVNRGRPVALGAIGLATRVVGSRGRRLRTVWSPVSRSRATREVGTIHLRVVGLPVRVLTASHGDAEMLAVGGKRSVVALAIGTGMASSTSVSAAAAALA